MKQKNGMPLAQAAAEDIIEMIRTNHMKSGDRLENEYELAKKLNVGRSTVREAVKSLETRNILTIKRGAGTFISQNEGVAVDPLGISLMGKDVRMILEPESAALAAIHADKNEIAEISRQNRKVIGMIRQGLNHHEEDARFHQLIAEATKNRIIAKLVPIIQQSVGLTVEMTSKRLTETTVSFHEQIVEAITRGDANGARSAMIAHISENRIYIIKEIERKRRFE
jgi:GntR family transcriptional repressor for pyruvate dehydrogenase complex